MVAHHVFVEHNALKTLIRWVRPSQLVRHVRRACNTDHDEAPSQFYNVEMGMFCIHWRYMRARIDLGGIWVIGSAKKLTLPSSMYASYHT